MPETSVKINEEEVTVSKSDVLEAFQRTEESLDDQEFEVRYSPWHFIEIDGERKPINAVFYNIEPVNDAADSIDDIHSVQRFFEDLGFEFYNRKDHAEEILRDTFEEILEGYPERQGTASKDKRLYQLLVNKAPNFLKHVSNKSFEESKFNFDGTAGQGNWPNIPWVAAKHPDETDTIQEGVYIVYLIDPEKEVIYASLNQGTTQVRDRHGKRKAREVLEDRAEEIREKIDLEGFKTGNPDLFDNSKLYEESTIYHKKYELGDLPGPDQIGRDFVEMAEAYLDYLESKDELEYPDIEEGNTEKKIEDFENDLENDSDNYFWVTADPSIWDVSELNKGEEKFYPAYLPTGNKARIFSNFEKASVGDKIIFYQSTPVKKIVAEGVVSEGLHEEEVEGYEEPVKGVTLEYRRGIEGDISWSKLNEIPDLEDSKPIINTAQGSIFKLEEKEFETILSLETPSKDKETYIEVGEDLAVDLDLEFEDLYFPGDEAQSIRSQINAALNSGKHIIFTGPPGTGKTEIAEAVASELGNDSNVTGYQMTTATADWSTFDTVGGFMPEKNGEGELEFNSGQVLKRFRNDGSQRNEVLVIDEINRSDIDKAFGQLFTLLSGQEIQLPYTADNGEEIEVIPGEKAPESPSEHQFVMPESWRILATMNSYDKTSLYEMSYAFMRRFAFILVDVPEGNLEDHLESYNERWEIPASGKDVEAVADIWERTNTAGDGRKIGPAIAKDMLGFVAHSDRDVATEAVINYVFPQLEGVRNNGDIVREIAKSDHVTGDKLRKVGRDMLQVKFDEEN